LAAAVWEGKLGVVHRAVKVASVLNTLAARAAQQALVDFLDQVAAVGQQHLLLRIML
jgi:hypothetical protein